MTEIVVDACCLINLLAAGDILPAQSGKKWERGEFPAPLHVSSIVANEVLYILQPDILQSGGDDPTKLARTAIDLSVSRGYGLLFDCAMEGEEESNLFVQLAVRLDDGEAASLAIAKNRPWTLATDDRVAATLAARLDVGVLNTAQLVRLWADHSSADVSAIRQAIYNIQRYAKFVPRRGSTEVDWWQRHAPGT
jgi:hypothetical protein